MTTTTEQEIAKLVSASTKLTEEVALQKDRLTGAANIATIKAGEASTYAQKATKEAAKAVQISGLETVDDAIMQRSPTLLANFIKAACSAGKMQLITDANGNANLMCRIPLFSYDDVGMSSIGSGALDCFKRQDGSLATEIFIGAYTASNDGKGNVIVCGESDPWHTINYDDAKSKCAAMGAGWHMVHAFEWFAIAVLCLANGFQPRGNTEYGRSHSNKYEVCKRVDGALPNDRNGTPRGLCGTGPQSWSHDNTPFGIFDTVGGIWEWIDGFKLVDNKFHISSYSGQLEAEWVATDIGITSGSGGTWGPSALSGSDPILKQMLIEQVDATKTLEGGLWYSAAGERLPFRGGTWRHGSNCGLAALTLDNERSRRSHSIGFRPAFIAA
ncbi:SUMF1/EgtB/PvdO family nonheme iron enzyme [Photobacterium phosphoreum]|nr:SUMF1/EgtB/PvdO family nonheme iron enzyme [Photobacterium phosphoreum]